MASAGITSAPAGLANMQQAGWDRALTDSEIQGMTGLPVLLTDDFNRADGALGENYIDIYADDDVLITSNEVRNAAGILNNWIRIAEPAPGKEWEMELTMKAVLSANFFRFGFGTSPSYFEPPPTSDGSYCYYDRDANRAYLYSGAGASLDTGLDGVPDPDDVWRMTFDGVDTFAVYVNDVEYMSAVDPSPVDEEGRYFWFTVSYGRVDDLTVKCSVEGWDATGGDIVSHTDGQNYHFFDETDDFVPTTSLSCDLWALGAGGGSGFETGFYGSPGAGGVIRTATGQSIATTTTVTIGAAGAPAPTNPGTGFDGGDTTIGGLLTATGGGGGRPGGVSQLGGSNDDWSGGTGTSNGGGAGAGSAGDGGSNNAGPATEVTFGSRQIQAGGGGAGRTFGNTTGNQTPQYSSGRSRGWGQGYHGGTVDSQDGAAVVEYTR